MHALVSFTAAIDATPIAEGVEEPAESDAAEAYGLEALDLAAYGYLPVAHGGCPVSREWAGCSR